ncbi:DNA polymerase II large subunit [Candidatus Woesearchaeota archaeon]|nr:DNA polymerase II large subunit [Candidatus Woesearchaeota archaeon]
MVEASPEMQKYFEELKKEVQKQHNIATKARSKGYDPAKTVEVKLAENMAERVVGLISVLAPQIEGSGTVERIIELEKKYGALDWRVSLQIALEIAQEKFCKFKTKEEAIDIGIRTGFAYSTVGVVSSPLDGFIGIDIKKRTDGRGEYFCLNYAGPIRNAGGTNAAVSVLIADYVRKHTGYDVYDAQEIEIKRFISEIRDYDERIAPRQHKPSDRELNFLFQKIPVEIGGNPTEKIEVSNYKDLPRIPTNIIRGGFALMCTDCIPLKAPKLWKQLSKWGKEFEMEQWDFLEEFIKIQKEDKAKGQGGAKQNQENKILPNYGFIADLVAGRPVFAHPLCSGGFRLRYGRSRATGYSACAIHPATMQISNKYLAVGTQIKIERPTKGCALTSCDYIEGPIVKLEDGTVLQLDTLTKAKEIKNQIVEILYFGDILISYGDFFDRAHQLIPAGYCEEWWQKELEKAIVNTFGTLDLEKTADLTEIPSDKIERLLKKSQTKIHAHSAVNLARKLRIPLHPAYTYYWSEIEQKDLLKLLEWIKHAKTIKNEKEAIEKLVLPNKKEEKRILEILGIPHIEPNKEFIVLEKEHAHAFSITTGLIDKGMQSAIDIMQQNTSKTVLEIINIISPVTIRDKSGIFIGARMGRPEKAKLRKLTGSPQVLFPVGEEGGKFRCFQSCLDAGKINAEFPVYYCTNCDKQTILPVCPICDKKADKRNYCKECSKLYDTLECPTHGKCNSYYKQNIDIKPIFDACLKKIGMQNYPELIKGVRGTSNKDHIPEHLAKGILRAKHEIFVNKDGTLRYDMTQLPITHFKPKEIGTPVIKLKEIGYLKDINGKELTSDEQVLELKPQDIILPDCDKSPDEGAAEILMRSVRFIDDLLINLYGLGPFYNAKSPVDLVGQLFLCLAPHTSAGIIGRLIGFSKTQGFFAHPLIHAATRRDCDGDEACVSLLLDAFLNFSKSYLSESRGSTMDAPLVVTTILNPAEVDDMAFNVDIPASYPLELYEGAMEMKMPWDVKIKQIGQELGKIGQYEGMMYTHDITDMNETVRCSAYKTLPSMEEKLKGQMDLAEKLRAVDTTDVARLVIEKHFLKDTKGNLRKFSTQQFRCVSCNEKFRRPPLSGKCKCKNSKIIFTIAEGSVVKYFEPTESLANKYNVAPYLKQTIDLLRQRIEGVFGKEKEKQMGLGEWFG